tara:strand:+ start:134 stop:475 length:342 start_codon:yes stop_codon:yes gene_type:complete
MSYKIMKSRDIIWCEADDRYILIERENNSIVGLNYMQGEEGVDYFEDNYGKSDDDLVDYYNAVSMYLEADNEVDKINQAIWAYAVYSDSRSYRETLKKPIYHCHGGNINCKCE